MTNARDYKYIMNTSTQSQAELLTFQSSLPVVPSGSHQDVTPFYQV